MQDDGGTANGGVDLDPTPKTMTINVTSVNDAADRHEQHGHHDWKTRPTRSRSADFGFSDPNDTPANNLLAVEITTLPTAGTLTDNGVAVTAGQFSPRRRHHRRHADVHAGGQCQRRALRHLHLPGAGRRRHGQRRRRSRSDAQDMTVNVTRSTTRRRAPARRSPRPEDTAYTFTAGDFGFSDPNDTPGQQPAGGEDHDAARRRHADRQRRGGHGRPVRPAWPTSPAAC